MFLNVFCQFSFADANSDYVFIPLALEVTYDVIKSSGERILFYRVFLNAEDI